MRKLLVILVLLVLAGCGPRVSHQLNFDPNEPLRVAVLPFARLDEKGQPAKDEARLFIDELPLVSRKLDETPSQIIRRFTFEQLEKTNLDILAPALIDIDLPHHGFGRADGTIDLTKLLATPPLELCRKFLNCDAVLYGTVNKWERSYYGLESVGRVGVEYRLVAARDNSVLFSAKVEDSEGRGLTKGPSGLGSLVVEPVRGLHSDIILEVAEEVVAAALQPLQVKSRLALVREPPPAIYAAAHDCAQHVVTQRSPLVVVLFGTPGNVPSFSIGETVSEVAMVERSPGNYYGQYKPLTPDKLQGEIVTVKLSDRFGRTSEQAMPEPCM